MTEKPLSFSLQHLPGSFRAAATFSQRWLCAGALRVSSKLWAIHHQAPEDSVGSLEEVWKTNKPISHSAALVATSKQSLLGPAQAGEGDACPSLLALPSPLDFESLKSQEPILAKPVLRCWARWWWLGSDTP